MSTSMGHPPAEEARSSKACCASPEAASRCRRVRVEAAGATLLRPSRFSASCAFAFVRRERPVETRAAGVGLKAWVSRPGRPPLSARVRGILAAALGDQSYPLPARTFCFAAFPVPLFMGEKATSGFKPMYATYRLFAGVSGARGLQAPSAGQNDGFETVASSLPPSRETLRGCLVVEHLVVHSVTAPRGVPNRPYGGAVRHLPRSSPLRAFWFRVTPNVSNSARENRWTFVQTALTG